VVNTGHLPGRFRWPIRSSRSGSRPKLAMEWATLPPDRHASWTMRLTDARGLRAPCRQLRSGREVRRSRTAPSEYVTSVSRFAARKCEAPCIPRDRANHQLGRLLEFQSFPRPFQKISLKTERKSKFSASGTVKRRESSGCDGSLITRCRSVRSIVAMRSDYATVLTPSLSG
jgi:hypothetical protein